MLACTFLPQPCGSLFLDYSRTGVLTVSKTGVHYVLCLLKRPVSVIVPWFLRQYRRLLALLALAETGIVVMTAHRINFEFQFTKPCTVYPGCYALYVLTLVQRHQLCLLK